jgi:hypothetical protein
MIVVLYDYDYGYIACVYNDSVVFVDDEYVVFLMKIVLYLLLMIVLHFVFTDGCVV